VPGSGFQVPSSRFQVPGSGFGDSGIGFWSPALVKPFLAHGTWNPELGTRHYSKY